MAWKDTIKNAILWNNISLTDTTIAKRAHLAAVMDKFTTFNWRGYNAFEPQFETSNGSLMGVTFEKQTISFKVGVYWISEDDFRQFINWLNPYEINTLSFGFEPNFLYTVKLANRQDSPRYILGYEGRVRNGSANSTPSSSSEITANVDSRPMYYSEMTLTFELQGTPCARAVRPYEWSPGTQNSGYTWGENNGVYSTHIVKNSDFISSQMQTPINAVFSFNLQTISNITSTISLTANLTAEYDEGTPTTLFNVVLTNLNILGLQAAFASNKDGTPIGRSNAYLQNRLQSRADNNLLVGTDLYRAYESKKREQLTPMISPLDSKANTLNMRYDSESGLLFLQYGSSTEKLLNLLNSSTSGERIVSSYNVKKFYIPGLFDNPSFDQSKLTLKLTCTFLNESGGQIKNTTGFFNTASTDSYIESYARTNVI